METSSNVFLVEIQGEVFGPFWDFELWFRETLHQNRAGCFFSHWVRWLGLHALALEHDFVKKTFRFAW